MTDCLPTWILRNRVKPWAMSLSLSLWAQKRPPQAGERSGIGPERAGLRALVATGTVRDGEAEPRGEELVVRTSRFVRDRHLIPDRAGTDDVGIEGEPLQERVHRLVMERRGLTGFGQ